MAQFNLEIAGRTANVHTIFDSTRDYFRPYLTEKAPHFSVTVTKADLEFEQAELLAEAHAEGFKPRVFTDPFLERASIQRSFAEHLFDHQTLLFMAVPSLWTVRAISSPPKAARGNPPTPVCGVRCLATGL